VDQQEQVRVMLSESLIATLCQALLPLKDRKGRIAAFEFMVVTNAISNLIRENKVFRIPSSLQTGKKLGMQLLDDHLFQLAANGKVEDKDAIDQASNPGDLQDKLKNLRAGRIEGPHQGDQAQHQQAEDMQLRK
jgi:twitching motility protein PilT